MQGIIKEKTAVSVQAFFFVNSTPDSVSLPGAGGIAR
jgi:hypothetical protein